MLTEHALAMLSAALRHVRDAEHLISEHPAQSPDQAYHLAGFGPECARKATLPHPTYYQAIGHGVAGSSEQALNFALATNPIARRYDVENWSQRYPKLANWRETVRYSMTGTTTIADAQALVLEAREIVDRIAYAMWADGLIEGSFTW